MNAYIFACSTITGEQLFVHMVLDEPLFIRDDFAARLSLSNKLAETWLDKLVRSGAVESHVSNGNTQEYRCPIAVAFWRQSMELLASSRAETLAEKQDAGDLVTSP